MIKRKKNDGQKMNCNNRIVYTVQDGDSLYKLAREYDTSVTELIMGNPGVNPYNLQVGMQLFICPGMKEESGESGMNRPGMPDMPGMNRPGTPNVPGMNMPGIPNMPGMNRPGMPNMPGMNRPGMPNMPGMNRPGMPNMPGMDDDADNESEEERNEGVIDLIQEMRLAWLDFIFWNRMYLMAVSMGSEDAKEIEDRVIQAVDEITDIFAEYLTVAQTRQLRNLLAEHVELGAELIRMRKEGNMQNYEDVVKAWYANANRMAELFAQINPYFNEREVRNMLLNYLDLSRESVEQQLEGNYGDSIETFRDLKKQVLDLADFFSRGLLAR